MSARLRKAYEELVTVAGAVVQERKHHSKSTPAGLAQAIERLHAATTPAKVRRALAKDPP